MSTWTLTGGQLATLVGETGAESALGSPLRSLEPPEQPASFENRAALLRAVSALSRPDIVLGSVVLVTGGLPEYSWFYGRTGEAALTYHHVDGDGLHTIAAPVDRYEILETSQAVLDSTQAAPQNDVSLVLRRAEFEALMAVVDVLQENSLRSLLLRDADAEPAFRDAEVIATCNLSREAADSRWMVSRAALFAPIALEFSEKDIRVGLDSLIHSGLAEREEGSIRLGVELGLTASLLGMCHGLFALSVRRRTGPGDDVASWEHGHFAGLRGVDGSLWLFEFSSIGTDDFEVEMTSVRESVLYERFRGAVLNGDRESRPEAREEAALGQQEPGAQPGPAPARFCRQCGTSLRAEARFCADCGQPVS